MIDPRPILEELDRQHRLILEELYRQHRLTFRQRLWEAVVWEWDSRLWLWILVTAAAFGLGWWVL